MKFKANNLELRKTFEGNTELTFTIADKNNKIAKAISEDNSLKGELSLEFKKWRESRSLDANAYLWVLLGKIAEHNSIKSTSEEIYKDFIKKVGVYVIVPINNNAVEEYISRWQTQGKGWFCEIVGKSKLQNYTNVMTFFGSSSYDTKEMSRLIEEVIQDAKELGIDTITPKQKEEMLNLWGKDEKYNATK